MTSQTDQIQTLIQEIDEVLSKASPRLPWVMSAEASEQRKVLEQTRSSLLSLQQQIEAEPPSEIVPVVSEESAQQVLQAFLQEMNYLRTSMLQPLRADIDRLNRERDYLTKDIQQLQEERQQLRLQGDVAASQQQMLDSFLTALMNRLQESLSTQIAQTLSQYEQEAQSIASAPAAEAPSLPASDMPLTPRQRLEHIRRTQARSDQLLMKLDSTLEVIFESLQSNVQGYQDSLSHGLEKMHNLGQQGEAMFAGLVNRLAEQLGREASAYLKASLESEEHWRSQEAKLSNRPKADDLAENLDDLSDEQIDRLLDELNGNSTEPAPETSPPPSLAAQNQDDDDRTVFQIDERRLQRYDQDEDVTVLQNQENAVEAARAMMEAARRRREAEDEQETFTDDEPTVAFVDPRKIDDTLDWLSNLNDDESPEDSPLPTEGVPDPLAFGMDSDPAIDQPENLYEDDFYNSLFGDSAEVDPSGDWLGMDEPPATRDRRDVAPDELDAATQARLYPREEDEILNEDANQELFGGLSDPSIADDPAIANSDADAATDALIDDADINREDWQAADVNAGAEETTEEVADEDLMRDESLSGLSTQALQNLFPGNEPLFADYATEDDDSSNDPFATLPPLDEVDEADGTESIAAPDTADAPNDESTADPSDTVGSLVELIEQDEPSGFLDTSRNMEVSDEDRYMPASPDEDLLGEDEDASRPLIELDEQALSELETDLSNLENPDAPAAIADESATWDDWNTSESVTESIPESADELGASAEADEASDAVDEPFDEPLENADPLMAFPEAEASDEFARSDIGTDGADDSKTDGPDNDGPDNVIALNAISTPEGSEESEPPSTDSPFDLSDDLSTEDLFEQLDEQTDAETEAAPAIAADDAIDSPFFPDSSEFIDEGLADQELFDEFEAGDDDLMEEAESLFDTVDTPATMMDVDDLLLPDPPPPSSESDAPDDTEALDSEQSSEVPINEEPAAEVAPLLLDNDSDAAISDAPDTAESEDGITLGDWFLTEDDQPESAGNAADQPEESPADFFGAPTESMPETQTQRQDDPPEDSGDRALGDWFLSDDDDAPDEPPAVGIVSPDDVGLSLGDAFGDAFGEPAPPSVTPSSVNQDDSTDALDESDESNESDESDESDESNESNESTDLFGADAFTGDALDAEKASDTTLDDIFGEPDSEAFDDTSATFDDAFGNAIATHDEPDTWAIAESQPEDGLSLDEDDTDAEAALDDNDLFGAMPALDAEPDTESEDTDDSETDNMIDTLFTSEPIVADEADEPETAEPDNTDSVNDTLASLFDGDSSEDSRFEDSRSENSAQPSRNLDNRFTLDNFLDDALDSAPADEAPAPSWADQAEAPSADRSEPEDELSPLDTLSGGLFGLDANDDNDDDEPQEDATLGDWFETVEDQPATNSATAPPAIASVDNELGGADEGDDLAMDNALNAFADAVEQDEDSAESPDAEAELSLDALFGDEDDATDEDSNDGLEDLMEGWEEESEQYTIDSLDELFGDDDSSEKKSL